MGNPMQKTVLSSLALTVALVSPLAVAAQGLGEQPAVQTSAVDAPGGSVRSFPSIFGAASAIPAPGGTAFVGATYANPRGGVSGDGGDGDLLAGYTFGNPVDLVSVTAGVQITGLDPFGDSGAFSLSLARLLRAGGNSATFVGGAASNLLAWGDARAFDEQYSGYVSHAFAAPSPMGEVPLQVTLGFGTDTTLDEDGSGDLEDGIFYGLGVGLTRNLSASISGTETQLNLGVGIAVPAIPGLGVSAGVFDITDNVERQQVAVTVAFSF